MKNKWAWLKMQWREVSVDRKIELLLIIGGLVFAGIVMKNGVAQLEQLNIQTTAMQGQLNSMAESNSISREALVAVQRAFVFQKDPTAVGFRDAKGKTVSLSFRVAWENSGSTPTKNLTININSKSFDAPPHGDVFVDSQIRLDTPVIIGPKATIYSDPAIVSAEDFAAIQSGKKTLFVWGRARYNDIFADTKIHRTRFVYQISWSSNIQAFSVSMYNRFNCADEECDRQEQDYTGYQPAKR